MRAFGGDAGRFLERKLRKELPGIFGRSSSGAGFFAPAELKKSLTILSPLKGVKPSQSVYLKAKFN